MQIFEEKNLVSIIIPTFNSAKYIETALVSILDQEYPNIEIIVVDDGSSDNTKGVLESYIESKKVKYFYQKNKGASSARNLGIQKASGQYIGFLDADDFFLPRMIEKCVSELEENKLDLVSVDNYMVYLDGDREIKRELSTYNWIEVEPEELFCTFLRVGGIGGVFKALFRRFVFDKVGYLDVNLPVYEDLDFWIRVAACGMKWGHIREPLVQYHRRGVSTSLFTKNKKLNQDCRLQVLRRYKKDGIQCCSQITKAFSEQLWDMGRDYILEYHSLKEGIVCFLESFLLYPNYKNVISSFINFIFKR